MKFEPGNIYFNKIYIIQSLRPDDKLTGTELYDDIIRWRTSKSLVAELINIQNKSELLSQFTRISQNIDKGLLPLIHFETHGFKEGIQLGNGDEVTWLELAPVLRQINALTVNNLFVSMASCQGGNIQFCVNIAEPSPFRGFIGPMQDVGEREVLNSYSSFFNVLLLENDVERGIDALNATAQGTQYHHMNAEAFFEAALSYHQKIVRENPNRDAELVDSLMRQQLTRRPQLLQLYGSKEKLRSSIKSFIKQDKPKAIEILRKQFCHIPLTIEETFDAKQSGKS